MEEMFPSQHWLSTFFLYLKGKVPKQRYPEVAKTPKPPKPPKTTKKKKKKKKNPRRSNKKRKGGDPSVFPRPLLYLQWLEAKSSWLMPRAEDLDWAMELATRYNAFEAGLPLEGGGGGGGGGGVPVPGKTTTQETLPSTGVQKKQVRFKEHVHVRTYWVELGGQDERNSLVKRRATRVPMNNPAMAIPTPTGPPFVMSKNKVEIFSEPKKPTPPPKKKGGQKKAHASPPLSSPSMKKTWPHEKTGIKLTSVSTATQT